ncbi:hypothetical protein D3C85_15970 [compost metagenome]
MSIADKSGQGVLLEALNKAVRPQGFEFAAGELTFGAVAPSSNPEREAEVQYSVTDPAGISKTINGVSSKITGSAVAYCDRLDLSQMFLNVGIEVPSVPAGEYATSGDVVAALNVRYDLGFTAEDIDFTVAVSEQSVVLTALASSYGFRGDLVVDIVQAGEPEVPLAEVVINPVLTGPDYGDVSPVDPDAQPQ